MDNPTKATRSKIGAMPWKDRDELCRLIHDGRVGTEIVSLFSKYGINESNLSAWRKTGYLLWLNEWNKTRRLRELSESAQHIAASAEEGNIEGVALKVATGKILELLDTADDATAARLIAGVSGLVRAAGARETLALQREKFEAQERQLAAVRQCVDPATKLSPDERAAKIRGIFGL